MRVRLNQDNLSTTMLLTRKLNDLKHVGFSHKIRLLIFQLKKTFGLSYAVADYQLNALLTTHLLRYNGFLLTKIHLPTLQIFILIRK